MQMFVVCGALADRATGGAIGRLVLVIAVEVHRRLRRRHFRLHGSHGRAKGALECLEIAGI